MAQLNYFQDFEVTHTFIAGQALVVAGQPSEVMYAVKSGVVELHHAGRCIETVEAGGVVGEAAVIDSAPSVYTAIARTDCTVAAVSKRRFMFLVHETPLFSFFMMRTLNRRTRAIVARSDVDA